MVKRTIIMLAAVTAIASSVQAEFNDDFESYTAGQEVSSPWVSHFGQFYNGNYGNQLAFVEQDTGSNGTQVIDLVDAAYWGNPAIVLPAENQYSQGFVQWDMATPYDGSWASIRTWWNTDGEVGGGGYDWVVNLSIGTADIWERPPGGNLFIDTSPANRADGVVTAGQWHTYRVEFDFLGGDGTNGEWSLFMDGGAAPVLTGALGTDGQAFTRTLKVVGWEVPSGDGVFIDNFIVDVPEPATGLLLVGGLACLIRRRG